MTRIQKLAIRHEIGITAAVFALCIFGLVPLMQAIRPTQTISLVVYMCMGVVGAAAALLAIWAVFGEGTIWTRMFASFGAGLFLLSLWAAGGVLVAPLLRSRLRSVYSIELKDACTIALCLPLVFLAIQFPLWFVRSALRWELSRLKESRNLHRLSIRDMLIATGIIAFGFAAARFAANIQKRPLTDSAFWMPYGVILMVCIGISTVTILPIIATALRPRSTRLAIRGLCMFVPLWVVIMILTPIVRHPPTIWAIVAVFTVIATYSAALAAPLFMARRRGFRLRWGSETASRLETPSVIGPQQYPKDWRYVEKN